MTIDTLFGKRFYLLITLELKSRRIIRFDLTENPCREFVKQRIDLFSEEFPDHKTLIFDNATQFDEKHRITSCYSRKSRFGR